VLFAGKRRCELGGGELAGTPHQHVDEAAPAGGDLAPRNPELVAGAETLGLDLQEVLEGLGRLADPAAGTVTSSVLSVRRSVFEKARFMAWPRQSARPVPYAVSGASSSR